MVLKLKISIFVKNYAFMDLQLLKKKLKSYQNCMKHILQMMGPTIERPSPSFKALPDVKENEFKRRENYSQNQNF